MSVSARLLNILFWSVISAAFIGPGTLTTAAKVGADFGLPLLWALAFATIACLVLQEASARLTIASGMNLGQAIWHQAVNGNRGNVILIMVAFMGIAFLLTGMAFATAGFKPVQAIIVAQALNGLILPVIAVFLFVVVNDPRIMKSGYNRLVANILMSVVVFICLLIGGLGLIRAIVSGLHQDIGNWGIPFLVVSVVAAIIIGWVLVRISQQHKQIQG